MLIKRTNGEDTQESVIPKDSHNTIVKGVTSISLSLHDIDELLECSPTVLHAHMKRLKKLYYNPLLGKRL